LIEEIRLHTFGAKGFQQIQVDAEYLRLALSDFFHDKTMLNNLINQVLSSAYKRCVDPKPVDGKMLETLLSEAS
jgi:hypothetical protein